MVERSGARRACFKVSTLGMRFLFLTALMLPPAQLTGQTPEVSKLKKLSIEELMEMEVTSVSRGPLRLTEAASAVQVITREDIRRSAATSVPEALRLAPNLQVAQLTSSAWIISARGFNTVFANKLLVLIDGRTVYTPLFAGVLWDQQHVLLEDVERIEVISGPGGSLWGVNAVNGVINIITRRTAETKGLYASVTKGSFLNHSLSARYGGDLGKNWEYRIYGEHIDRANAFRPAGERNDDAWRSSQIGFRAEYNATEKDMLVFQGEAFRGERKMDAGRSPFDGQFLMATWSRKISEKSDLIVQGYADRYWRNDVATLGDELTTWNVDVQHQFRTGRHNVLWGMEYRHVNDLFINYSANAGLLPPRRTMPQYSAFVQDQIAVNDEVSLTLGTKLLHNFFSGFEFQPSIRAAWNINSSDHTIWAAVSRAVRAPSRFDVDYRLPLESQPPNIPSVAGGPSFDSEYVHALEFGLRTNPNRSIYFSVATYYNRYFDVYSVEALPGTLTYQIQNGSEAETWGAEVSGLFQPLPHWRIRGGLNYFRKDLRAKEGREHDPAYLSNDARHHAMLQSILDLPWNLNFDVTVRYVDYIRESFATVRVPEYGTFDARLAWVGQRVEVALCGQNLGARRHAEFGSIELPRGFYGRVTCRL